MSVVLVKRPKELGNLKRILLPILMIVVIVNGCSNEEVTITEMDIENVKDKIESFIKEVESLEEGNESGIYLYNDSENKRYLYLNENFLDEGEYFGDVEIQTDEDAIYIYLTDTTMDGNEATESKLYQINMQEHKEYLKVFKNDEETHFANIGM